MIFMTKTRMEMPSVMQRVIGHLSVVVGVSVMLLCSANLVLYILAVVCCHM